NFLWELDGYAAFSQGKPDTSGSGGFPAVWSQTDYSNTPFYGYTQGPGYYGKTFFIWPPDPRNTTALSGSTLTSFLTGLGVTLNPGDASALAGQWSSMTLSSLQTWLTNKNYTAASTTAVVPVTNWNGTALT